MVAQRVLLKCASSGVLLDILVQDRRNAARRFFEQLRRSPPYKPCRIVIDGLCSQA